MRNDYLDYGRHNRRRKAGKKTAIAAVVVLLIAAAAGLAVFFISSYYYEVIDEQDNSLYALLREKDLRKRRAKALRFLAARGFSGAAVAAAMRRLTEAGNDDEAEFWGRALNALMQIRQKKLVESGKYYG